MLRKILDFPIADADTSSSSHLKQEKDQEVIILYLDSLFGSLKLECDWLWMTYWGGGRQKKCPSYRED